MIRPRRTPQQRAQAQVRRLFGEAAEPSTAAARWAQDVLREVRVDAGGRPLAATRALRRADPRLGWVTARYLAEIAAGRQDGRETPPRRRSWRQHALTSPRTGTADTRPGSTTRRPWT